MKTIKITIFHVGSFASTFTTCYVFTLLLIDLIMVTIVHSSARKMLSNCTHEPEFIGTVKWQLIHCISEAVPADKPIIILPVMEFLNCTALSSALSSKEKKKGNF